MMMRADWYKPNASLEFPRGGSMGIVSALLRYSYPSKLCCLKVFWLSCMTAGRLFPVSCKRGRQLHLMCSIQQCTMLAIVKAHEGPKPSLTHGPL